jgi:hypothetical protein
MGRRIRSIKPEILDDEVTARLGHLEWRLFVSLWLVADDYGNLRGDPEYVRGAVLWASRESREDVARALECLASEKLVEPYEVRGQSYLHVTGWRKHQKVDRPSKALIPSIDESMPVDDGHSRETREILAEYSRALARDSRSDLGSGIRDQGASDTREGFARPAEEPARDSADLGKREASLATRIWFEFCDRHEAIRPNSVNRLLRLETATGWKNLRDRIGTYRGDLEMAEQQCRHVIAVLEAEARKRLATGEHEPLKWFGDLAWTETRFASALAKSAPKNATRGGAAEAEQKHEHNFFQDGAL